MVNIYNPFVIQALKDIPSYYFGVSNVILPHVLLCVSDAGTIKQGCVLHTLFFYNNETGVSSIATMLRNFSLMTISGIFLEFIITYMIIMDI